MDRLDVITALPRMFPSIRPRPNGLRFPPLDVLCADLVTVNAREDLASDDLALVRLVTSLCEMGSAREVQRELVASMRVHEVGNINAVSKMTPSQQREVLFVFRVGAWLESLAPLSQHHAVA